MTSSTMTVRLGSDMKERLELLAEMTHRSKSYLAAQAINEFLITQEWQLIEIKKGIKEADEGHLVDHASILSIWEKKKK